MELTPLQIQAQNLGCPDVENKSEFELHAYIKRSTADIPQQWPKMNVFNVFCVTDPEMLNIDDKEQREKFCDRAFNITNYHLSVDDEYFIVRRTQFDPSKVFKLNPNVPEEHDLMAQLIQATVDAEISEPHN